MIWRIAGWSVAGLALLAAIGIASTREVAYDLASYTEAARRLLAGEPLYPLAARVPMFLGPGDYIWHPTTAVLFIPIALVPHDLARALWTAGLVALAGFIGYRLIRPLRADVRPWATAGYVLFFPLIAELTLGNLNLVTLSLCLLAWHLRARLVASGAVLALGIGIKLLPFALPLFFLAAGLIRIVAWTVAFGVALLLLTYPLVADEWPTYVGLAAQIAAAPAASGIPIAPTDAPFRAILFVAAVTVMVAMGRSARDLRVTDLSFAVALAAVPLVGPFIWYPYLVFALPLFARLLQRPPTRMWVVVVLAWLAMQIPMRVEAPAIAFGGLLLLIGTGVVTVVRERR